MGEILIRPIAETDAHAVADLSTQLGYPSTADQVRARLARLGRAVDHAVLVAAADGPALGWIHLGATQSLESEPFAELLGLVVDQHHRGQRIGERLVLEGLAWARRCGFAEMRVRTNVVRADAHRFYERLGFKLVKTQKVFARATR